jgi:outer membrane protein assembly factor BamB|tara:strand:+ start:689 stop:1990 length:1302 start_codon:yes stop_codon:yes gene_type:complete
VNNIFKIILIFFLITGCSLNKNSKFWTKEEAIKEKTKDFKEIFKKEENLSNVFNPNLKISIYSKAIDKSFLNNLDNNNGRIDFNGNLKNISKYKFSKIENFHQYDPKISFYNNDIIFFDNKGSILRFNENKDIVWKINNYSKSEKKQNPILFFANNKKTLIVADNISNYYAINIKKGNVLWSKNNTAPFNSQIKIYKDKFFIIDLENVLRAYLINDGTEIWNIRTENSLIRSQKKLSMVIIKGKIYFNNFSGDISAVDIASGELLWQTPTQSNLIYEEGFFLKTSDIIADNETLYFSNNKNQFFSLDIETGYIKWEQKINSNLRSTLIDNYIFAISLEGYLIVIEKNTGSIVRVTDIFKNFKVKKRKKIKPTGFIVGNDSIYLSTNDGKLIIIDITTGNVSNIIKIDKDKITRPSIINENMFIITDNSIIKLK